MGIKHSLLMKFGQLMSYCKRKKFINKFYKNYDLKSFRPVFTKNLVPSLLENEIFEASYLYQIDISKTIKICPNHHTDFLRFLFTEDCLKIKKGLELVSRPHFSQNFLMKKFLLKYYMNQPSFITRLCLLAKLFSKMCFVFHAQALDDVMTFEYLKS